MFGGHRAVVFQFIVLLWVTHAASVWAGAQRPNQKTVNAAPEPVGRAPRANRLHPSPQFRQIVSAGESGAHDAKPDPLAEQLHAFETAAFPPVEPEWAEKTQQPQQPAVPEPVGTLVIPQGSPPVRVATPTAQFEIELPKNLRWLTKLELPDLPIVWTEKLLRYLEFYRSDPRGRRVMTRWLRRKGRYGPLIAKTLRAHKLPRALTYVAMIESAYSPAATSPVGAAGLWQFMPHAGKGYGLTQDYWVDQRRNPRLSTEAGVRYLKDLYQRFGDWHLALAAYNAGYGSVVRAIRKYNTNDYWQLCRYEAGLPWSTSLYVPKILAAAIVGTNPRFFGYNNIDALPALSYRRVPVEVSVSLEQIAQAAHLDVEIVRELNQDLYRERTPPARRISIRLPKPVDPGAFKSAIAAMRPKIDRYQPYVVKLGDSERSIARRYGIARATLRRLNQIKSRKEVRPGVTLLVPARKTRFAKSRQPKQDKDAIIVALPANQLAQQPGKRRVFYRIVSGDTLSEIAERLTVKTENLARWNGIRRTSKLQVGMVLQAWVAKNFNAKSISLLDANRVRVVARGGNDFHNLHQQQRGRIRILYSARAGDSLWLLSRRFGLSVGSIMRINQFGRNTKLEAGRELTLYVELDRAQRMRRYLSAEDRKRLRKQLAKQNREKKRSRRKSG